MLWALSAQLSMLPGQPSVPTLRPTFRHHHHEIAMRERDWTPLRDGVSSAGRILQSSFQAASQLSSSDLFRFAQHEVKSLMSGELLRQFIDQLNAESADAPAEDQFELGKQHERAAPAISIL